ncbi:hypothetical protein JTE90_025462, partial [Oedothorax gibbosus]
CTNIDYELQRLEEKAEELNSVDKKIHMLLTDTEYDSKTSLIVKNTKTTPSQRSFSPRRKYEKDPIRPFLLCAATRELASKHMNDFPTAAPMLDKSLYMDDFVASVETEPQVITLQEK